jgi:hypothetical protein
MQMLGHFIDSPLACSQTQQCSPRPMPEVQPAAAAYRIRVMRVQSMPFKAPSGSTFEYQLGLSLYDEAVGSFYGNTCYSLRDISKPTRPAGQGKPGAAAAAAAAAAAGDVPSVDVDFTFDVYFHTSISDPRCMAVAEVIAVQKDADGVVTGEYSIGWSLLPLFKVRRRPHGCCWYQVHTWCTAGLCIALLLVTCLPNKAVVFIAAASQGQGAGGAIWQQAHGSTHRGWQPTLPAVQVSQAGARHHPAICHQSLLASQTSLAMQGSLLLYHVHVLGPSTCKRSRQYC